METFLLVTVGWIFSLCLHEFGHAIVAFKGGDYTVKDKGYLTLNPIHYTHPVYSFIMPLVFLMLGGIGLPGGAVYINHHLLRSKKWESAVSLAGPAVNIISTLILCIPFWTGWIHPTENNYQACALAFLIQLEISAVIFNLLPVPSLDGFGAISPWLPQDKVEAVLAHSNTIMLMLFLVFWNVPVVRDNFWNLVDLICVWLQIDPELAFNGWKQFRFWKE